MKFVPAPVTRAAFRGALILRKHAPEILFAGGVVGSVTSTIMACKATLKLADELPVMKKRLEQVREQQEIMDEAEYKKEMTLAYLHNVAAVGEMYAPAVIVGVVSVGALTGSHVIIKRREGAALAAYATVNKAFDEYRKRVEEEMGKEREENIYRGTQIQKIKGEDGKSEKIAVVAEGESSPYARFFDESSRQFTKSSMQNRIFIQCQQDAANDRLRSRGYIFLNDVYESLGLEHTKEGQIVGWLWNSERGDEYVDFNMYDAYNRPFVQGDEPRVLLDFNVDGPIWDKI